MTICKNCQTSLSQGARFCPECGEKVSIFCTSCGASITLGATFCGECGEKIAGGAEPFHAERGDGASISLGVYPSSLSPLKMAIDSIVATGPDREKEYSLCIKFQVGNNSQSTYSSIFISAQIYNSEGFIIQESKEDFDEEIEAGDSAEFETYISSVKAGLLGDSPEGLKVVLNAYATELEAIKLSTVQLPSNHYEVVSLGLESDSKNLELVSGSVWIAPVWDESDPTVVARVCIQNKTTSYIPKAKLTLDVLDKGERSVNDRDSYEELVPGGFVSINVECQIPEKKADGCFADITLSLARQVAAGNTQSSGVEIEASDDEDEEDEDESGSKRIYIKTEPGGKIVFGKLDDEQTDLLLRAIESEDMPEELLDLRSNSDSNFREYEGVINSGEDGDAGNEGIIEIDSDGPVELPKDSGGDYEDGAYLVYLSLSKVSIEFEFEPSDGKFDSDKFTEISVPIDLPDFIEHDLYGHPSFNVVTGYQYDDEYIEEYDGDLVDRGYDDLTAFILVKDGEPTLVYKNYNGEESWNGFESSENTDEAGDKKSIEQVLTELYDDNLHLFQKGYFQVQYKGNDFKVYQEDGSYSGSFLTLIHHILYYEKLYEDYFSQDTAKLAARVIKNSPDLPPAFEDESETDNFDELIYDATQFTYEYMKDHKLYCEEMNDWIESTEQDWALLKRSK